MQLDGADGEGADGEGAEGAGAEDEDAEHTTPSLSEEAAAQVVPSNPL